MSDPLLFPTLGIAATLLIAVLFFGIGAYTIFVGFRSGAPFVRSSKKKIGVMLDLAQIQPGEIVLDLGSGDGTLLLKIARRGAYAIGIEKNRFLVLYSRLRTHRKKKQIRIVKADFFQYPIDNANVLFLYLLPKTLETLKEKIVRELKPGSRIVSNTFPIPGWTPEKEKNGVFLYRKI